MEYRTGRQLGESATIFPWPKQTVMSRIERLQRWIELLELESGRCLNTLEGIEYLKREARDALRHDDSPLSVAFADPVLRAEGLVSDTYGDARDFFEMSDRQMHRTLCYCHYGTSVSASTVARRLRNMVRMAHLRGFLWRSQS